MANYLYIKGDTVFTYLNDEKARARFVKKINFAGPNGCWLWVGFISQSGYGLFDTNKASSRSAHRVSYEWTHGSIDRDLVIDHLCSVKSCVNPEHLEQVSFRENILRGLSPLSRNKAKTHCPLGHELKQENLVKAQLEFGRRECKECHNFNVEERRKNISKSWKTSSQKTACKNGHELTEDNIVPSALLHGERKCRACHNDRVFRYENKKAIEAGGNPIVKHSEKSTCRYGHPWNADSWDKAALKRGKKICGVCRKESSAKKYLEKKSQKETPTNE